MGKGHEPSSHTEAPLCFCVLLLLLEECLDKSEGKISTRSICECGQNLNYLNQSAENLRSDVIHRVSDKRGKKRIFVAEIVSFLRADPGCDVGNHDSR